MFCDEIHKKYRIFFGTRNYQRTEREGANARKKSINHKFSERIFLWISTIFMSFSFLYVPYRSFSSSSMLLFLSLLYISYSIFSCVVTDAFIVCVCAYFFFFRTNKIVTWPFFCFIHPTVDSILILSYASSQFSFWGKICFSSSVAVEIFISLYRSGFILSKRNWIKLWLNVKKWLLNAFQMQTVIILTE